MSDWQRVCLDTADAIDRLDALTISQLRESSINELRASMHAALDEASDDLDATPAQRAHYRAQAERWLATDRAGHGRRVTRADRRAAARSRHESLSPSGGVFLPTVTLGTKDKAAPAASSATRGRQL